MPEFDVPMKWDLRTVEKVIAKDPHEAEHKASMTLEAPHSDPSTWKIEKRIDGVDWQGMEKLYPTPEPPDPMKGWECLRTPGAYEGGLWKIEKDGYEIHLIGDDGPIDVGMSFTKYTWKISGDSLPADFTSKLVFNDRVECRDSALEMVEHLKGIGKA